jgi:tetratricopeptide (TPR) repeat protein
MKRGDYAQGKVEFTQSLALKRKAAELRAADDSMTNQLATTVAWYAESVLKIGDMTEAMALYREEEKLLRSVKLSNATTQGKLAFSLMRQALLSVAMGNRDQALIALRSAEKVAQSLVEKDPTNRNSQIRLLTIEGRLAELQLNDENPKLVLARLQATCDKLGELYSQDPKNTFLAYQTVKFELGRTPMLITLGRIEDAIANANGAISKLEELHQKALTDKTVLNFLTEGLLLRAGLAQRLSGRDEALPYCQRASELLSALPSSTGEFGLLASRVRANLCLGHSVEAMVDISRLKQMGYRDERYIQFISTHPALKGKL